MFIIINLLIKIPNVVPPAVLPHGILPPFLLAFASERVPLWASLPPSLEHQLSTPLDTSSSTEAKQGKSCATYMPGTLDQPVYDL